MIFEDLPIAGAKLMRLTEHQDERGFFARLYEQERFASEGIMAALPQANLSYNAKRGTLRGLHFQKSPGEETKVVRCLTGRIFDVLLDLRIGSPTHRQWHGVELSGENRLALCVPAGCAHGFITLSDEAELLYLMSSPHSADLASGLRFDDPWHGIQWPIKPTLISERDRSWPLMTDHAAAA
jgi:dTDP-4-dehydrorhamnose 3,5-epimerase